MQATETGLRWCVRLLSIVYYFAIGPFLYDLFLNGARPRSAYLFPFILLAVIGLHIGYRERDRWVQAWYWFNLALLVTVTALAFFSPAFASLFSLAAWEKWVHLAGVIVSIFFLLLGFVLPPKPMKMPDEEEDLEQGLPPIPNQNPAS